MWRHGESSSWVGSTAKIILILLSSSYHSCLAFVTSKVRFLARPIFSLRHSVQNGCRSTQLPMQLVSGIKKPAREAGWFPPSGAEIKNVWSCTSAHPHVLIAWCIMKHGDYCTLAVQEGTRTLPQKGSWRVLPQPSQFIVHNHPFIRHCIIYTVDRV